MEDFPLPDRFLHREDVTTRLPTGRKDDGVGETGAPKDRWHLLLAASLLPAVRDVVLVLMPGERKYARDNWAMVEGARDRYYSAAIRHLTAWMSGERDDAESGLPHLSHAVCCALFLAALDKRRASERTP